MSDFPHHPKLLNTMTSGDFVVELIDGRLIRVLAYRYLDVYGRRIVVRTDLNKQYTLLRNQIHRVIPFKEAKQVLAQRRM